MSVDKKTLIGWLISILVPCIIFMIPTNDFFTADLKLFLIITLFVILIIAFELLPQLIAAFLMPSLYLISGLVPVDIAFGSWTSTTVWIVLGGLVFANVLDDCGLLKRIAYFVIRKCGGTYMGAVFGCFVIGCILNIITFCNGWLVASALVFGVCKAMDLKPSKESSLICFAGTIGATGATVFLYYPGYYALIETSIRNFIPDYTMGMFETFKYNGIGLPLFVLMIFIMKKIYRIDSKSMKFNKDLFDNKYKELGPVTIDEKKAIVMIILLLSYLFSTQFTGFPSAYGFMLIPFVMYLPGIGIGKIETLKKINFPTIFFVATCLGIGTVGAAVGFGDFLQAIAVPLLAGKSPLLACIVFMMFGMIANFFMTPYAMLGGLSLPFAQIAVSLGMNPVVAVMILLWACEILYLPYESAGNLIMYQYGLYPMKEFVRTEGLKSIVMIIAFIIIMYPMWNLMGLM